MFARRVNFMPPPSKLRLGVIGTGMFAEACHIPGLQSHPRVEVAALCGRRADFTRALADRFGIPDALTDIEQLLTRPDIDAVTVATPNAAHAAQVGAALAAGKHVLCEKPLGVNVAEVREMTRAAERSGKVHQVAFTFRYNYGVRDLRRRLKAGDIGQPFYIRVQNDSWDGLNPAWRVGWREKQELAGGGMLFDIGSHLFDIARHLLGPITSAIGFTQQFPRTGTDRQTGQKTAIETDDLANVWFRHGGGVRGQFFTSRVTPPFAQNGYIEVIGPEGALKASLSRGSIDFLKVSRPTATEWTDLDLPPEAGDQQPHALGLMMRSFVDACLRGSIDPDLDASFHDGLAAQEAIAAVLASQSEGRWVEISEVH
jgi:predicted dehydrogenase